MKINLTKKQYRDLIRANAIANTVLGILGDSLPDTNYKELSNEMEALEEHLLQYAKDFDCKDWVEEYDGKNVLTEDAYEENIMSIISDYDEEQMYNEIARRLAWRDFIRDHTKEEIEKMREENAGYFGVQLFEYEKKYWDEFEEYGMSRFEIRVIGMM